MESLKVYFITGRKIIFIIQLFYSRAVLKTKASKHLFYSKDLLKMRFVKNQSGQIIVEYILLLVLSVTLAVALSKLASLSDSPLLNFWTKILKVIAEDIST